MGTEIFPQLLRLMHFIIGTIIAISAFVCIVSSLEYAYQKRQKNPKNLDMLKRVILDTIITTSIALLVYFLFSGIGPAFRLIFTQS